MVVDFINDQFDLSAFVIAAGQVECGPVLVVQQHGGQTMGVTIARQRGSVMVYSVNDVIEGQSEFLQHEWQEQLGVKVRWQAVEWVPFFAGMAAGHMPPLHASRYTADYPDPDDFLRAALWLRGVDTLNSTCNELVDKARQIPQQAERLALYRRTEEILAHEAVAVPLTYARIHLLLQPWVRKCPISPVKWWFWKDVIIDKH